jgi:hypothetical protein
MRTSRATLKAALWFIAVSAWAQSLEAPPDALAAQAAGLQRLGAGELKSAFAGPREERNVRGQSYVADYAADGQVELKSGSSLIDRGTFSVTGQDGGLLCLMLEKQMNQRLCTVWFAAPDRSQLFGYNPTDGLLRTISGAVKR